MINEYYSIKALNQAIKEMNKTPNGKYQPKRSKVIKRKRRKAKK